MSTGGPDPARDAPITPPGTLAANSRPSITETAAPPLPRKRSHNGPGGGGAVPASRSPAGVSGAGSRALFQHNLLLAGRARPRSGPPGDRQEGRRREGGGHSRPGDRGTWGGHADSAHIERLQQPDPARARGAGRPPLRGV